MFKKTIVEVGFVRNTKFWIVIMLFLAFSSAFAESEEEIGKRLDAECQAKLQVVSDDILQREIDRIGNGLVKVSTKPEIKYTFRVYKEEKKGEENAFSLPGGFVWISLGLTQACQTEDEIAGVLAHEIVHCASSHGVRTASAAQKAGVAGAIADRLTNDYGIFSTIGGLITLRKSRKFEGEADKGACEMMKKAGYDPIGLAGVFANFIEKSKDSSPEWLSNHPDINKRYQRVVDAYVIPRLGEEAFRKGLPISRVEVHMSRSDGNKISSYDLENDLNKLFEQAEVRVGEPRLLREDSFENKLIYVLKDGRLSRWTPFLKEFNEIASGIDSSEELVNEIDSSHVSMGIVTRSSNKGIWYEWLKKPQKGDYKVIFLRNNKVVGKGRIGKEVIFDSKEILPGDIIISF